MSLRVARWLATEAPGVLGALRLDGPGIEAVARRRLAWLLARAARVPFYSPLLGRRDGRGDPLEALRSLPPVDKAALRLAGASVLEGGSVHPSWRATRSSGSTGEPFRVHYEPRAWVILKYLVKGRARLACGVRPGQRIAILDTPSEGSHPSPPRHPWALHRISALQPPEEIAAQLAAFRPAALYGLPSVLLEAAAAGSVRPRLLFTSGELLSPQLRARLEDAYGCRVHDVYGTTETKEIAWECAEGKLHVNADVLHVEVLDEDGERMPAGEEGRIVVTVLVNSAMPLLRYQTGDRGALIPGECPCGVAFPLLGVVTGREVEYLDLGEGRRLSPYQLTCAIERVQGIRRFQVVQRDRRLLTVRAEPLPGAERGPIVAGLREALAAVAPVPVTVEVELDGRIGNRGEAGKFQVVRSLTSG